MENKQKKTNNPNNNESKIDAGNNKISNNVNDDNISNKKRFSIYHKNVHIYGWGKNKYGELGIGHNTNINSPFPLKIFQNQLIRSISSGGKHSAVLLENGSLYVCGADVFNLLGTDNKKWKEQHKFNKLTALENEIITQVACAEFHTLCLNDKGQVFAWGGTLHRQSQTGKKPSLINSLLNKKIIEISCGDHHSAALTDLGEVFTWGGGGQYNRGQCGHGDLKEVENPKRIEFFIKNKKKAIKVVCGGYHTMVLCDDNHLYGFGKGSYGQLGYGAEEDSTLPKLVKFSKIYANFEKDPNLIDFSNINLLNKDLDNSLINNNTLNTKQNNSQNFVIIKDFKCGGEHTIILSTQGRVYTFGHGYTGQLGQGNSLNYNTPTLIKSLLRKNIISIAAGWSHSMILTSQGYQYVTGCGKYGELGLDDDDNRKNFTIVRSTMNLNITRLFSGGHHSWILVDSKNPEKNNLASPSPIGSLVNSPKSVGSPRILEEKSQNKNNGLKNLQNDKSKNEQKYRFDLDLLAGKIINRERFLLQVAYTDLKICHRFIRFSISPSSRFKDISFKDLNILFQNHFKNDRSVVTYRLQDDNDINLKNTGNNIALDIIMKEVKNNFKLINLNRKYFYSVVIVYDYNQNPEFLGLKDNIEEIKNRENSNNNGRNFINQNFCDIINLNEDDIEASEVEKILSGWVIDFMETFRELIEDPMTENLEDFPKFLELRPNCFYIS